MAYPPAFTAYSWEDLPSENTPVDKHELNEAEKRLAKFAEEFQGVNWRPPVKKESELNSLYKPKGGNVKVGDVAFVYELEEIFVYGVSEEWKPISAEARHWKAPVKKESELPVASNVLGDVRLVEELGQLFYCIATVGTVSEQWKAVANHVHTIESHTWVVAGEVTEGTIPGPFVRLAANETQTLTEIEFDLIKGKAEVEVEINGSAVKFEGGSTKVKIKEAVEALKLETPHTLSSKDRFTLVITSVTSTPEGLTLSAFVEHVVKVV